MVASDVGISIDVPLVVLVVRPKPQLAMGGAMQSDRPRVAAGPLGSLVVVGRRHHGHHSRVRLLARPEPRWKISGNGKKVLHLPRQIRSQGSTEPRRDVAR